VIRMSRPGPLTDGDLSKIADAYNRGASIRALADLRGWSYGYMHRRLQICQEKGLVTIRSRGGRARASGLST